MLAFRDVIGLPPRTCAPTPKRLHWSAHRLISHDDKCTRQRFLDTLAPKSKTKTKSTSQFHNPTQIFKKMSYGRDDSKSSTSLDVLLPESQKFKIVRKKSNGPERHDEASELDALMEEMGIA